MELNVTGEGHLDDVDADVPHLVLSPEREGHGDEGARVSYIISQMLFLFRGFLRARTAVRGMQSRSRVGGLTMYGFPAFVVFIDQALRGTFRCFMTMQGIRRPRREPE